MNNKNKRLPGDYIAGFIDGEGCFFLTYRKETKLSRKGNPTYYRWSASFAMTLREDDIEILEKIRDTLECGNVYLLNTKDNRFSGKQAYFGIQNANDLYEKVKPFFKKYPLRAKKRHDFALWAEALEIIYSNKKSRRAYSVQDHKILSNFRNDMRVYKQKSNREYANKPILLK